MRNQFVHTAIALGAATVVLATAHPAFADKPTIGIEWEINPEYAGIIAIAKVDHAEGTIVPADPADQAPEALICSQERSLELPNVAMTYDLAWIPPPDEASNVPADVYVGYARTLEIVTAPIDYAPVKPWDDDVLPFVTAFFKAVESRCKPYHVAAPARFEGARKAPVCVATVAAIVEEMNGSGNLPSHLHAISNASGGCDHEDGRTGKKVKELVDDEIGVFFQMQRGAKQARGTVAYDLASMRFDDANTQVNIALDVATLGVTPIDALFLGAHRTKWAQVMAAEPVAYQAYQNAFALVSTLKLPASVKGFLLLYAWSLNAHAYAQVNGVMGFMRKNLFDLYLKTPLGELYQAIVAGWDTGQIEPLDVDDDNLRKLEQKLCVVRNGEDLACRQHRRLVLDAVNAEDRLWEDEAIMRGWHEGMASKNPRERNPLQVVKTIPLLAGPVVVVEARFTGHPLNVAAHLTFRKGALAFVDHDTIVQLLAPLRWK